MALLTFSFSNWISDSIFSARQKQQDCEHGLGSLTRLLCVRRLRL